MASCDDDFGLLGDDTHQPAAPPPQPATAALQPAAAAAAAPPAQAFCFAGATVAAGAGSFAQAQEESNHHAERGKAAHHAKRARERPDEFSSDGGEYCSYINSGGSGGGGGGKKGRGGGGSSGASDYRKDREEWTDGAISSLLDAYTDRFEQLNRGNLRGRDWEDVAAAVTDGQGKTTGGKSIEQCKNKIDNLKKRYKVECQRLASSGTGAVSHWAWFKKMEQIVGTSASPASSKAPVVVEDEKPRQQQQHASKRCPLSSAGPLTVVGSSRANSLSNPRWKRVLLKIGGTALAGAAPQNVDPKIIMLIAREVQVACHHGVEVAIVVGGRNIFCGDNWVAATGTDRASTYPIGMMASVMNSVLLQASLEKIGVETRVQTALMIQEVAEPYVRRRAIRHLEKGRVVIFGGIGAGIGNPLFTTDTAAALRASETAADMKRKSD
ncbi:uncharacterized protein LOC120694365 isoform X3 [Panicum virgatum]|uniref:uncharacterized protein LOC120640878 isoform X3 n=1 Tax=Panicum virgatum TaxID=38727 RepID=UPI0019D63D44|nr:uncharacterized protein LOC120640878 isoform X3 [Panicum virgatum]XP_039772736.1 uncharacterized protein LOC120640878 isoform X3 [Panicum virgatum]XP_039833429.1 uncharacterized protein LOC120694365 isoform X3 [Panicum virgatum]XP_039833430.1 uncharacterized protein LOC120694365 isoform X3 [Panicum virgatum]